MVGITLLKTVDMVALGLVFFPRKRSQVGTQIDIVGIIPVGSKSHPAGKMCFQHLKHVGTDACHAKPCVLALSVLYQFFDYRTRITFAHRHHVGQFLVYVEAEEQKSVFFRNLRAVQETPAVKIGKTEVAVLSFSLQGILLYQGFVFDCYGVK